MIKFNNNNFSKSLELLPPELIEIIYQFKNDGYILTEKPSTESVKMSQVVLIDPINDEISLSRITIKPNPNYKDYLREAHEYPVNERPNTILPYTLDAKTIITSSQSGVLNEAEFNALKTSPAFHLLPQNSNVEPGK